MAADPGPLRWAWSKTAAPADNLDLISYNDAGDTGTTVMTYTRADAAALFVGAVTAPAVNVGANPVIADPQAGNALVFGTTGLFVPASATFVPTVITPGNGVSAAEAPVGTWAIGLVLDPAVTNTLTLSAAGLLSTATATVIAAGNGVTAAEAPAGTYTIAVLPDPVAGNALTVSATGVAVAPGAGTVVVASPGLSAAEAPVGTWTVAPVVDPVVGNMLAVSATGLAVVPGSIPISADPGNLLELRADGFYVRAVGLVFGMP
jgi:hypothetical protein